MKKIVTVVPDSSGDAEAKTKQLYSAAAEAVSMMRPDIIFSLAVHTVMRGMLEEMGIIEGDKDTAEFLKNVGVRFASVDNLAEVLNEEKDEDGEEVPADSCQPMFSAEDETTNPQH